MKQCVCVKLRRHVSIYLNRLYPGFFGALLGSQQSRMEEADIFHMRLSSRTAFAVVNTPPQRGAFLTTGEPTLTHHHLLKPTVDAAVQSWCCAVCGFGRTHDDTRPPARYPALCLHCPSTRRAPAPHPCFPAQPGHHRALCH